MAPIVGGKGGGRPDMAQGGGTQPKTSQNHYALLKIILKPITFNQLV